MDDLFGDLIPVKKEPPTVKETLKKSSNSQERTNIATGGPRSTPRPVVPDVFNEQQELPQTVEPNTDLNGSLPDIAMSKEALQQLLSDTVQNAVDATFGKFVKSLRTVLEDMSKRIEANGAAYSELKESFSALSDLVDGQAQNVNSRFTNIDMAIREVDRGVQALRDKQELHEAQALLAKYSEPLQEKKSYTERKAAEEPAQAPAPAPAPVAPSPLPLPTTTVASAPPAASTVTPPVASSPAPQYQQQVAPQVAYQQQQISAPPPQHQQQQISAPPPQHQQQQMSAPPPLHQQQAAAPPAPSEPQYNPQPQAVQAPQAPYATYQQPVQAPVATVPPPAPGPYQAPSAAPGPYQAPPAAPGPYQAPPAAPGPYQAPPPASFPPPPPQQFQQPPALPQQQQQQHTGHQNQGPPNIAPPMYGAPPQYNMPPPAQQRQGPPPGAPSYPVPSMPSYPAPLSMQPSMSYRGGPQGGPPPSMPSPRGGSAPPPQSKTNSSVVPIEQIISDISLMGFERHQVMTVINNLQRNGQAIDLNVILDKLTRGDYR